MDLRQYLRALRKYWWAVAIPIVVGVAFGVVSVKREAPMYRSSVTFFVRTTVANANSNFSADQFAQRRVSSYVALLSTDRLAKGIIERADLDMTPKQVQRMIGATGDIDTVLLTATVTSPSAELTTTVADALSEEFVVMVDQVENAGDGPASVNLDLVSGPTLSQVPKRPIMTVGLFGVLGVLIGLACALAFDLRDKSLHSDEEIIELGGGPILASIPFDPTSEDEPLTLDDQSKVLQLEAFRKLRTNLQFVDTGGSIQVLVVTSSVSSEGKSQTSANLALAMVAAGRKVLVIEADLRRPMVSKYFGLERSVGLSDAIVGHVDVHEAIQPWGRSGLFVLTAGHIPPNPSELLDSEEMRSILISLRDEYEMIIIDTPPLLPVTDAAVLAARADGVVLVVRHQKTTQNQMSTSVRALASVGARFLGTVVTMVPVSRGSDYASYDYSPIDSSGKRTPARHLEPLQSKHPAGPAAETRGGKRQGDPIRAVEGQSRATTVASDEPENARRRRRGARA
ncbi:MAG: polysaccharide biosynthesis tyrosine autokinase [Microthrixaceae bacterium]|nr:polysaccharide biosynthesis tyrosine autokinase [Microthrixaceae bacterium]